MKKSRMWTGITLFFILLIKFACASLPVTVIVNTGGLGEVKEAAQSEEKVDWWDNDLADDRACTESFAATELAYFLPNCTNITAEDVVLSSAKELPSKGDVFIIGSRISNPLIATFNTADVSNLKTDESFRIKTFKDNDRTITIIEGKDRVGTLYGVYSYLEQLGMRFYGLGDKYSSRAGKTIDIKYPMVKNYLNAQNRFVTEDFELNEPYKIPSSGTIYPVKPVDLPQNLDLIENPSYLLRGFWAWENRGQEEFFLWMARNRMNFWTASAKQIHFLKKLGMVLTWGQHTFQEEFINPRFEYPYDHPLFEGDEDKPKDPYKASNEYTGDTNHDGKLTYFEAHPEWFGMKNGKRSDNINQHEGTNYCTSNTDASKELANNLINSLINGNWRYVDTINLWMSDNGIWCQCDNCKKLGNYTDQLFESAKVILSELKKAREKGRLPRKVQLFTIAYHETLPPPTNKLPDDFDYDNFNLLITPIERCLAHPFADRNCSEINAHLLDKYLAWTSAEGRTYKGQTFICDYYNVSSFFSLPLLFTKIIANDIPYFYSKGTKNMCYMHPPDRLWGTWTLNQYLFARLMWNVNTDVKAILDNYFKLYYPSSSNHARKFYEYLEEASLNCKPFKHYVYTGNKRYKLNWRLIDDCNGKLFDLEHLQFDSSEKVQNNAPSVVAMIDFLKLARKELDAALIQCSDDYEKQRLLDDERRFSYGEVMYNFLYHLIRTSMFHKRNETLLAKMEFAKVEEFVGKLGNVTDLVHASSSHANAVSGFEATQTVGAYNFFKKKYAN